MELEKNKLGMEYYESLPDKYRLAEADDFYAESGKLIVGKPFLVHSYYDDKYQAYRTSDSFTINKIKPWLDDERVFVLR